MESLLLSSQKPSSLALNNNKVSHADTEKTNGYLNTAYTGDFTRCPMYNNFNNSKNYKDSTNFSRQKLHNHVSGWVAQDTLHKKTVEVSPQYQPILFITTNNQAM